MRGSRRRVFDPFHWVRRDAEHARLPLSVTATAVTPSPPGKGASPLFMRALGRDSPTVAPLRVGLARSASVERGGDLLRRPTEVTRAPPAMQRGWGHVLVRAARFPGVRGRQPRFRGSRGQCPLGPCRFRVAPRPLRGVTPASAARPPRAVPSRKLQGGPTRVQHDRRRATQSRAGCGHCPPGIQGHCPLGDLHDRVAPRPLRGVTPASAARPLRAVPSRKPQGGPTRAQHDRRCATQSRERGVKPLASRVWALPTSRACVGRRFLLYWYLI